MPRRKKDGVFINYYIRRDIKERLDKYCEDVGQTNTTAIERILKKFLDEYESDARVETKQLITLLGVVDNGFMSPASLLDSFFLSALI